MSEDSSSTPTTAAITPSDSTGLERTVGYVASLAFLAFLLWTFNSNFQDLSELKTLIGAAVGLAVIFYRPQYLGTIADAVRKLLGK